MNRIRDIGFGGPSDGHPASHVDEGRSEGLLEALWRRRWTVFGIMLLALLGGVAYLQRATPRYESTSRIYVEPSMPRIFPDYEDGGGSRSSNYLHTQAELLSSTPILSDAMRRGDFAHLRTLAGVSNQMNFLQKQLHTVVGKKDDLISVVFESPYAEEAAHIVNTVVDAYVTFHSERKRNSAAELLKILTQEKAKRDIELNERLAAMMAFKQQSESLALGSSQDSNVILGSLQRLSLALTEAQLATMDSQAFRAMVEDLQDDPQGLRDFLASRYRGPGGSNVGVALALRSEYRELQNKRERDLRTLQPSAPAIEALDAEMARLEAEISDSEEAFVRSQLAIAVQREQADLEKEEELARRFEEGRQQAIDLNDQLAQYTILQSGYEQTKKLCDTLDERIKELSVIEETGALNITVLEAAEPAIEPSKPQKADVMMLALGLGLFAGTGAALLREWRDQRLCSAQEISALLGLPILGVVPAMGGPRGASSARGQKIRHSPDSAEAEAYRTIRTAILFHAARNHARTILVASPAPGEGKSTSVTNLGIAMAQAGQKVLILDADFRRPTQHTLLEVDRERRGLSLVLEGRIGLQDATVPSGIENLDVLTAGPEVPNPAEMLNSERFRILLENAARRYDRVLVDSPPVMAVTDAVILASLCDITVLVVRAGMSTRAASTHARKALAGVDAEVLGVVINDVSGKEGGYGYAGSYRYHQHQKASDNGKRRPIASAHGNGDGHREAGSGVV